MKRAFLTGLGITDSEVMKQIIDFHQGIVQELKEDTAAANAKLKTAQTDLKTANETISAFHDAGAKTTDGYDDWKAKHDKLKDEYDALNKGFEAYKTNAEAEKTTETKRASLRSHLKAEGVDEKLTELLEGKFDLAKVEVEDGKIKGWGDLIKPLKERFGEVFGTITIEGANAATPPASQPGATYTLEQIKSMTPAQINANWDKGVRQAIEGGR